MSYVLTTIYPAAGGDAAAQYAAELSLALNVPLRILYPYTVPVAIGEMPIPLLPVEEVRDAANGRLDTAVRELKALFPALNIEHEALYGNLGDVLDNNGKDDDVPLLTVICNNEQDDSDTWIGGESDELLREGKRPILAVPAKVVFQKPRHVCIACDTRSINEGLSLATLPELHARLGFRVTVLHVTGTDGADVVSYEGSQLEQQLSGIAAGYIEISAAGEINEAIASFADTHEVDWLAMAPHHYGFWAGLFHKSHTSRVLHLAHVPVLALHDK